MAIYSSILPGELHGQRILADYSPWDCRESDSTEQLTDVQNGRTYSESESHAVVSNSLQPHGLYSPWNSPGQNSGVARIAEWVAFPFSRGSSQPRDRTQVSLIAGGFFTS